MDRDEILLRMSDDTRMHIDSVMDMYLAPFARLIGIEIDSIEKDRVECHLDITPENMNSMGRGHGGVIFSLIDHTFAIHTNMTHPATGQSANISYYRPATGRIRAVSTPINRSRSLEMYDVKAYGENGKLVASAVCTAFILRSE